MNKLDYKTIILNHELSIKEMKNLLISFRNPKNESELWFKQHLREWKNQLEISLKRFLFEWSYLKHNIDYPLK